MNQDQPTKDKAAGSNIPFSWDWAQDLAEYGDTTISESHWTVEYGSIQIGADGRTNTINGSVTTCFISGGQPAEVCVLNNSILLNIVSAPDTGDKLVRRFGIRITGGQYLPGTPPVVILPDGIPNLTDLAAFRGATPGVSVWVDTTPDWPDGTIYYAVPQSSPLVPDGSNVVQGQLIKWVELHAGDGGTGAPLSRRIDTTTPLHGGGDLSADRTLTIDPADGTHMGTLILRNDLGGTASSPVVHSGTYNDIVQFDVASYGIRLQNGAVLTLTNDDAGEQPSIAMDASGNQTYGYPGDGMYIRPGIVTNIVGSSEVDLFIGAAPMVVVQATKILFYVPTLIFKYFETSPTITQEASSGAAEDMNIIAQTGGAGHDGGSLFVLAGQGGTGNPGGDLYLSSGIGTGSSTVHIQPSGTDALTITNTLIGLDIPDLKWGSGVNLPRISQATTSGAGNTLTITAQSSSANVAGPAALYLNAGVNNPSSIRGAVGIGFDSGNGNYALFQDDGVSLFRTVIVSGSGSESYVLARVSGITINEDIRWFQHVSAAASAFNFDVTVSVNGHYRVDWEVTSYGGDNSSFNMTQMYSRVAGTLATLGGTSDAWGIVGLGSISYVTSAPDNNTIRLAITPDTATSTTWLIKAKVRYS